MTTTDEGFTSETGNGVRREEGFTSEAGNGVRREEGVGGVTRRGERLMRMAVLAVISFPVALAAQETCRTSWYWNSIGVDGFHCGGGHCSYDMIRGSGIGFTFSAEPRLRALDPAGPSAGRLQEGDVLVAVNERLILTGPGGAELGKLAADRDANITVRRGDRLISVQVRPKHSCRPPTLLIGETVVESANSARTAAAEGAIDLSGFPAVQGARSGRNLGIWIRCPECGFAVFPRAEPQNRIILTVGRQYPVVAFVARAGMADLAGIRIGDEIRRISGVDVLTEAGTPLLVNPPPGEFDITIVRAGRELVLRSSPLSSLRTIDGMPVERALDQGPRDDLRVVRQGDTVRSDDVLGTVIRWWRSIPRDEAGPAMLVTRGEAWGDGDLGFLVGSDRLLWRHDVSSGEQRWWFERPLRVVEVIGNSLAERAGLRKDDVITHANDLDVHTEAGARALLLSPRRNAVILRVQRDGREVSVTIPPRAM